MSTKTAPARKRFRISPPVIMFGAMIVVAAIGGWFFLKPKAEASPYTTTPVSVGNVTRSVSASGTMQALVTVDVGSQTSGQLKEVRVDFDSPVSAGQVLAIIDPVTQTSKLQSAQADLDSAAQAVSTAEANLAQTIANAQVTQADYNRTKSLFDQGIVSKSALEKAEAQLASSQASVKVSQNSVKTSQLRQKQSNASVEQANTDLDRTIIKSPINGVVVNRKVDVGSTVAASLNAPVLFTIAQDLTVLQLKILVDEADIGQVRIGQDVGFTVDAYPNDNFTAQITQVRKAPETSSNVVAYVVMASAQNPDLKLLPGMTANAEITLERHTNVIRIPNGALRWAPIDPNTPPAAGRGGVPGIGGAPGGVPGIGGAGGRGGPPGGFGGGGRGGPGGFGGGGGGFPGAGGAGRGGRGGGNRNPIFAYDQLNLPVDVMEKIEKVFEDQRHETSAIQARQLKAVSRNAGVDRAPFQKQMQDATTKARTAAEALLSPAQKAQLDQLRANPSTIQRGQVYVLRDGKPYRIGIGIGVTDGSVTQAFSTAFKQGDLVITGGGPQPKT